MSSKPVVIDARVVSGKGGGPDKTILNSPRFLDPLGYEMHCVYLYPEHDPGFNEIRMKAEKYNAPLIAIPDRGPFDWRIIRDLYRVCRDRNAAIWHGHDYKSNALGLILKRFWPMRLVTTAHGWVEITDRTPYYYRIDRWCLPRYERVYCVSEDLYDACRRAGVREKNCELLENGIDTEEFSRSMSVEDAKRQLNLPTDGILVGAMGRLSAEKAFDTLIHSVHDLNKDGLNVRAVIVGEGNQRPQLEQLIRDLNLNDRVTLAGWQSDVKKYDQAFDVFALSSLREGLPNVLLESMALGVPCLATRIAGIPRLIADGENGLLVEAGDRPAFTRSLKSLVESAELRKAIATRARKTIEDKYSFRRRMNRLKESYDELLRRKRC